MEKNENTKCPICNSSSDISFKKQIEGYKKGEFFNIYHCNKCITAFFLPQDVEGSDEIYQIIYAQPEKIAGYNRYGEYANKIKNEADPLKWLANQEAMYWSVNEAMKDFKNNKDCKFLEVGCGLGYLTFALNKSGYNTLGLDISQFAIEKAKKNYGNFFVCKDVFEYATSSTELYDMVIMTEVIEHVRNPKAFLEALQKLVKHNGKILITTPNRSIDKNNAIWDSELPPVHYWWFSETSFETIAKDINSNLTFIDFTNFNKTHFDYNRVKNYGVPVRTSTIDESGNLIQMGAMQQISKLRKLLKLLRNSSIVKKMIMFLWYDNTNIHRSGTIGAFFSKGK